MKEASHKGSHMVSFIWDIQNRQIYKDRLVVAYAEGDVCGLGVGKVTASGSSVSFWSNVLVLVMVIYTKLSEHTKNDWIVHFKWVNCMTCE